ncbi:hypothetical protein [Nitrospira defluvii]|uniref:Uncharacterized protein n=1 Tax=Nitrospira defluvii TaxID=330214 RepID=A0ABM8R9Z3_9BACT|nr:hypothetical protein [Nitrospira defluvii]CAE6740819.1 conserved hypothetical protein [Nitrospira defluvii]
MSDSTVMIDLRVTIRNHQNLGMLPCEGGPGRRFQVLVSEVVVVVLREVVNLLCLEGLTTHLLMSMDEGTPYVGLHIDHPHTILWIYPSPSTSEVMSSVRGGLYLDYNCDRTLPYRGLTLAVLETVLVEQLRLVLCPPQPIV